MNQTIAAESIKSRMPLISRLLFTLCGIGLPVGAHVADLSPSHIFNDHWQPHAKFHTGQTLSMSILLSLFAIFFAWRKTMDQRAAVFTTAGFSAAYWITQATAILYPNTAFFDPEFITASHSFVLGLPTQAYFQIIFLLLIALASWLALRYRSSCCLEALQQTGKVSTMTPEQEHGEG